MRGRDRLAPVVEALVVLLATLVLAVWLRYPTLWFLVPFAVVTVARRPYEEYGLTLHGLGSARFHAVTAGTVFGSYALLHLAFARTVLGLRFAPSLPPDFAELAFVQLAVIGLSEEFFFRGYLQTELDRSFGRPFEFLGARFGWGLIVAALLFGLCHLVTGDLTRMRVTFFGLFAGWLRARTDSIAVPAAYHGCANILAAVLSHSMVP